MVGILYGEAEKGRRLSHWVRTDSRTAQTKRAVEETPKKTKRKERVGVKKAEELE